MTVTGVDDGDIDWNIYFTIETALAVSTDPAYSGFNADDVEVVDLDDDGPAIYVTHQRLDRDRAGRDGCF